MVRDRGEFHPEAHRLNTGLLLCFLGMVAFGLLGACSKAAERRRCDANALTVTLFAWATLAMLARAVAGGAGWALPAKDAVVSVANYAFQSSIRMGKLSTAWLMMNLSAAVPALASVAVYGEHMSARRDTSSFRSPSDLAIAETHPPEEAPLDVRSDAAALSVSPTTLYKYGLKGKINAAEQRQQANALLPGAAIEQRYFQNQIAQLKAELEKERERSKGRVSLIAIVEANAARLDFNPEEMYKPILKPVRTMSRAGRNRGASGKGFHRL